MPDRYEGPRGTAVRLPRPENDPTWAATVDSWLMDLPDQAPGNAWTQFWMNCITLASVPGFPAATKKSPDRTHELMVVALEPDRRYEVSTPHTPRWRFMQPTNVVVQFTVRHDDQAREVTELAAKACTNGLLVAEPTIIFYPLKADGSLDYDNGQVKVIKELYDAWLQTVPTTAEHVITGGHHGTMN